MVRGAQGGRDLPSRAPGIKGTVLGVSVVVAECVKGKRRRSRRNSWVDKGCFPSDGLDGIQRQTRSRGVYRVHRIRCTVTLCTHIGWSGREWWPLRRAAVERAVRRTDAVVRWVGVHGIVGGRTGAPDAPHHRTGCRDVPHSPTGWSAPSGPAGPHHRGLHFPPCTARGGVHRVHSPPAAVPPCTPRVRPAAGVLSGEPAPDRRRGSGAGYSAARSRDASASCFRRSIRRSSCSASSCGYSGVMRGGVGSAMRGSGTQGCSVPVPSPLLDSRAGGRSRFGARHRDFTARPAVRGRTALHGRRPWP